MDDLLDQSVRQIAEAIATKQVTSAKVTRGFLDRIEKVNPQLNAVINLNSEAAMKYAERADIALSGGETPGPLFGVPMTIKDSLDTFDMVTTWGTTGRKDFRPGRDATCVGRLRQAGAILMGKTNTPEFTLSFQTNNLLFGRTNNPHLTDRTPGGSSGGAAAIIAAAASPFDVGTDTGGSIRLPSHFSGIAGIKPTTGRVPCTGNALPSTGFLAPLSQPGPMARTVDDLIYLLEIMQGPDNIDPHAVAATWHDPFAVDVGSLRVGFHTDNGIKTPDAAITNTLMNAVEILRDEGPGASEARPSGIEMAGFIFGQVFRADNGEMVEALLEDCRTETISPELQQFQESLGAELSAREFAQVINLWHNFQSSMLSYFDDFDVLISPVNAHTAIMNGAQEELEAYTYTNAYNMTGWPGVVIRAGTDESGLPIGLQILASPFREDHCLAVAGWLEARLGSFPQPGAGTEP
jgi:amidase